MGRNFTREIQNIAPEGLTVGACGHLHLEGVAVDASTGVALPGWGRGGLPLQCGVGIVVHIEGVLRGKDVDYVSSPCSLHFRAKHCIRHQCERVWGKGERQRTDAMLMVCGMMLYEGDE